MVICECIYLLGFVVACINFVGVEGPGDDDGGSVDVDGVHQEQRTPIPSTLPVRSTVFRVYRWCYSDFSR